METLHTEARTTEERSNSLDYFVRKGSPIVAPATAPGGPVGIVRVSGEDLTFLEPFLETLPKPGTFGLRRLALISPEGERTDEVLDRSLILSFQKPHSFTGEDVVEIHCHGVPSLMEAICVSICRLGALPALPGEFSFRAFLNGKMSLSEAEGLQQALARDDLSAEEAAHFLGADGESSGELEQMLEQCVKQIQRARGRVEAAIDFPEAEAEQSADLVGAETELQEVRSRLSELLTLYEQRGMSRGEFRVALVGAPNVGKSTLLNLLCGSSRALVSEFAGTTRDFVEVRVRTPNNKWVRLFDTAGLRALPSSGGDAQASLEREGMKKAIDLLELSQIILFVRKTEDESISHDLCRTMEASSAEPLYIYSHADQMGGDSSRSPENAFDFLREAERVRKWVFAQLDVMIARALEKRKHQKKESGATLLVSSRQERLIDLALQEMDGALECIRGQRPLELTGEHLFEAESALKKILGVSVGDEYIGQIFSQFCLGK